MKPRETARKGTAELGLPPAASSSSKTSLRSKFNESAPPAWFRSTKEVDDDARSEADSVVSEFRDDGPDSAEASTAAVAIASSGSEAAIVSPVSKKSNLELELPAIPHRQRPDVSPMSASRSSLGATSNKSYEEEVQVSASTAGEWVTRLAALQEVAVEHSACAGRIWDCLKDMFPEVDVSTQQQLSMQAEIFQELEMSRQLLEQHAQGLVGTDLAELRMIQAETKRANDKLLRMDKLYAKEKNALRTNLEKEVQVAPKEDYEPLLFLEPEERGCVLTLIQEQLEALLTENPNLEFMMNQKEYTKLQELFKKERHSTLERQVAKLTQHLEEVTNQVTLLEAENEKLQKRLAQARRVSSSSSIKSKERGVPSPMPRTISGASGSGEGVPRTPGVGVSSPMPRAISGASGEGIRISSPAGKPKAGRPKRGAKYSRPGPEADDSDV